MRIGFQAGLAVASEPKCLDGLSSRLQACAGLRLVLLLLGMLGVQVSAAQLQAGSESNATNQSLRCFGSVLDTAGATIPGAIVELYQDSGLSSPGRPGNLELKQQVTADTGGAFEFRVARVNTLILARKAGLAPAWRLWVPSREIEIKLVLTSPDSIGGTVVDEKEKPVSNAVVCVTAAYSEMQLESGARTIAYISGRPARACFSARTEADGRFRIEGIPTNTTADLTAFAPNRILRESDRTRQAPNHMHCRAGQPDLKLALEPAASIEGTVVAQDTDRPLAGARLVLLAAQPGRGDLGRDPVWSDTNGSFRVTELGAGNYHLHATFDANTSPDWVAEPLPLSVEAGQVLRDVRVVATRGGWIEVAVTDAEDRQPVPQATVIASQGPYQSQGITDIRGLVSLRLPPGEYRIRVSHDGIQVERPVVTAESGLTNRIEIEFSSPPKISGILRDVTGTPVPGQRLIVFPESRANIRSLMTDAKGEFGFTWPPSVSLDVPMSLIARDEARNLVAVCDIEEGARRFELRFAPGLALEGRVVDPEGQPLANATVHLLLQAGNVGFLLESKVLRTGEDGKFEASALPPGRRYSITASARGFGPLTRNCQLEDSAAKPHVLEPFKLKRADRPVTGQVLDASDRPAINALVRLTGPGQPGGTTRTDGQGRFLFEQACEGQVQLLGNLQGAVGEVEGTAGDTNIVLKLGPAALSPVRAAVSRASLKDRQLPELTSFGISAAAIPDGKRLLLCLVDFEQRPSRRLLKLLAEQQRGLEEKGLAVLAVQAVVASADGLKEWLGANPLPFPIGRLAEVTDQTRWASQVESLPWLILTDAERRVVAEGFSLEEIDARLNSSGPQNK